MPLGDTIAGNWETFTGAVHRYRVVKVWVVMMMMQLVAMLPVVSIKMIMMMAEAVCILQILSRRRPDCRGKLEFARFFFFNELGRGASPRLQRQKPLHARGFP